MVVVENTPAVHNVIVCTLCSCYPWPTLGLPPAWYKDPPYRARMVREPRALLAEMGCALPGDVEIRVWDSSAEVRYLVLPERPPGTGGMTEAAGRAGHPGLDDRRGPAVSAQLSLPGMDLPRRNGELAFDTPWQSRVFALAAAVVEHAFGGDREPFRVRETQPASAPPQGPRSSGEANSKFSFSCKRSPYASLEAESPSRHQALGPCSDQKQDNT